MNLTLLLIIFLLIAGFLVLVYNLGKNSKEKEIINNNTDLKKKYDKKKFNSIDDVIDNL